MPTFLQQDGGGVARDVVLQVGAPRQPVGQVHGALLPTVEVALGPPVKPEQHANRRHARSGGAWPGRGLAVLATGGATHFMIRMYTTYMRSRTRDSHLQAGAGSVQSRKV